MKATSLSIGAMIAMATISAPASAASFVNGDFELGTVAGWTTGGGFRGSILNSALSPALLTSGTTRSEVIGPGSVDPNVSAALFGSTVYSGTYSYRVEDTVNGGNASFIQQRVNNYTDPNIFFAWKSVLEGAHGVDDAATMLITLTDLTTGTELIRRQYNAASTGGGVDARFASSNNFFYTPKWQIEQLAISSVLAGHDFLLSVLGSDCEPTGHTGYVYLDGFGAAPPVIGAVPELATWGMMISGFAMMGGMLRRRRATGAGRSVYALA